MKFRPFKGLPFTSQPIFCQTCRSELKERTEDHKRYHPRTGQQVDGSTWYYRECKDKHEYWLSKGLGEDWKWYAGTPYDPDPGLGY